MKNAKKHFPEINVFELFVILISMYTLPHTSEQFYITLDAANNTSEFTFLDFINPQWLAVFMAIVIDVGAIFAVHKIRTSANVWVKITMFGVFVETVIYSSLSLLIHQLHNGDIEISDYWLSHLSKVIDLYPVLIVFSPLILGTTFTLAGLVNTSVAKSLVVDGIQYDSQKQKDKAQRDTLVNHLKTNKNLAIADVLKYDDSLYWYPTKTNIKLFTDSESMLESANNYFSKTFGKKYMEDYPEDYNTWLSSNSGVLYNG